MFAKLYRLLFPIGLTSLMFALTANAAGSLSAPAATAPPAAVPTMITPTITLTPAKDNTLYEDDSSNKSNGAGGYFFAGRTLLTNENLRRGLLSFDVVNQLPANAKIITATLSLYASKQQGGAVTNTFSIHRVESDWGEGTSDAGANGGGGTTATVNDATWLHTFYDTTFWNTAGGDYVLTPTAAISIATVNTSYDWSNPSLVADIQSWLDGDASDYGWIVIGDEAVAGSARRFNSRENNSASTRPQLTLTYQFTPVPPTSVNIIGISEGLIDTTYTFTASIVPTTTTTPITYTWTADDQSTQITNINTINYSWPTTGTKQITVTADNAFGTVTQTHTVNLAEPLPEPVGVSTVNISGPVTGTVNTNYDFLLTADPISTTLPITYTVQATDQTELSFTTGLTESIRFNWAMSGVKTITVTADNGHGTAADTHTITIADEPVTTWLIYLPILTR